MMNIPAMSLPGDPTFASVLYDRIQSQLEDAQNNLKDDEQLLVTYYLGSLKPFTVRSFGFRNPYFIVLDGTDDNGNPGTVLVHCYRVELIISVTKVHDAQKKREIGFLGTR